MMLRSVTILILLTGVAFALPKINSAVTDPNGYISSAERAEIAEAIREHKAATGVQIAVLLVGTTNGVPISDYSMKVAREWGGGSAARDDGLLFVLAVNDRRMRIEVGYGLEPAVPDARAAQILAKLKPKLRTKQYGAAAMQAVTRLREATRELNPNQVATGLPRPPDPIPGYGSRSVALLLFALLITVLVSRFLTGRTVQLGATAGAVILVGAVMQPNGTGWAIVFLLHLGMAQILLRGLLPRALGAAKPEEEDDQPKSDSDDAAPKFFRMGLFFAWFGVPLFLFGDSGFAINTTTDIIAAAITQLILAFGLAVGFGVFFHLFRFFNQVGSMRHGGPGTTTTTTTSGWDDTFSSSSWTSSSSDWSSSDWSSSDTDWGGGGGDFGGGGASDSW